MEESILISIKKLLGIEKDYDQFDQDIIIHINSSLMSLNQLGVGPKKAFTIANSGASWKDLLGDTTMFEGVKTYIYLKVRLVFDPPINSSVMDSIKEQIKELEWRLTTQAEEGVELSDTESK